MALTVKEPTMKEELALFEKLLDDPYYSSLKGLIESGEVKVQFSFYNIALHWGNGQVIAANMPLSIPTLQSIAKGDPKLAAARKVMSGLYKELTLDMGHPSLVAMGDNVDIFPTTDIPPEVKEKLHAQVKASMEKPASAKKKVAEPVVSTPKLKSAEKMKFVNTGTAIPLRTAVELGQLVKGTSPGSKYYMVAGNDHLKFAIRKQKGQVSIRAEGTPTLKESQAMSAAGMTKGNSAGTTSLYWSVHMALQFYNENDDQVTIPAGRVVGAFLMGLGIKFDQAIINIDDIPEDA